MSHIILGIYFRNICHQINFHFRHHELKLNVYINIITMTAFKEFLPHICYKTAITSLWKLLEIRKWARSQVLRHFWTLIFSKLVDFFLYYDFWKTKKNVETNLIISCVYIVFFWLLQWLNSKSFFLLLL